MHVLLPEGANSALNVVSREVLDMAFRADTAARPTSFHPEDGANLQHWQKAAADAEHDAQALADNYDVLQDVPDVGEQYVGHFMEEDGNFIDRDADGVMQQQDHESGANPKCSDGQGVVSDDVQDLVDDAAGLIPQCMAPQVPYIIEGYQIDYKKKYSVASAGHLTLLPDSYLNIHATHPSKFNSAIAAMRFHGVAFRADLASFGGGQTHPVRWSGQQADRIRPILAKEYLLLPRIQQLKLAYADVIIPDPTGEGSAALEDACIAKFAHEIGTEGCFMRTSVFWLISQVCVVGAVKAGSSKRRPASYWSPFSVCLFEVDSDSLAPGSVGVAVKSNNIMDWTALVHQGDNPNGSIVTLACVLLNQHYSSAEICPKQIAGGYFLFMYCIQPEWLVHDCFLFE